MQNFTLAVVGGIENIAFFLQSLGAQLGISFSWLKSLDFTRALELAQRLAKATLAAA